MSAEKINEAETLRASYEAQKNAELARAEKKKATQAADVIVPAEIDKRRIEIEAEAEAERIRRIAKGNADSIYYEMEAKANNPNDAVKMMIADKITEIVKMQTEAVQNLKIDKVTVWDSMSGGKSSTANFLSGMLGSLPPLNDIFKSAGLELPDYLKGKKTEEPAPKAEKAEEVTAEPVEDTEKEAQA